MPDLVPSLDAIAEHPQLVRGLPRPAIVDLALKATAAQTACMIALTMLPPPESGPAPAPFDELLGVEEAARRLGMSPDALYHRVKLAAYRALTVRNGTRNLRFSAKRIEEFIRRRGR